MGLGKPVPLLLAAVLLACSAPCVSRAEGGDVSGVWPPAGGAAGGTPVALFGETYFEEDDVFCVFGASSVPAAVASPFRAACTSPPGAYGFVSVHLSLNGVDVGDELSTEFLYTELVDVQHLTPVAGDTGGGAVVWLGGKHFSPGTACVWGTAARGGGDAAAFVSTALVRCEAPPLPTGAATVRAGVYAETSDAGATFVAYAEMVSLTATPALAHASGGTQVLLAGDNFRDGDDAGCAFGTVVVSAAVVGAARAACLTPAHAPGSTALALRVQALSDVGSVGFAFVDDAVVDALTFAVSGHLLELQLYGTGLSALLRPRCGLGGEDGDAADAGGGALLCTLPALPGAGYTALTLSAASLAEALLAGAVRTPTYPRSAAVQPAAGSAGGGAVLSLVGSGFDGAPEAGYAGWCELGGMRVAAQFVSSALVLCESPPAQPGPLVAHSNSANSASAAAGGAGAAVFWALPDPIPRSLYPDIGSLMGGSAITVRGSGLADAEAVLCRIGTVGPLSTASAGDGALTCITPARGTGLARLALGLNAQQYSADASSALFLYAQAPAALGVTPVAGPLAGGGALQVITDSMGTSTVALLCSLGTSAALPLEVTALFAMCALAPGAPGFARIALLTSADDAAAAGASFMYYEPPAALAVLPATASAAGGTVLLVSGAHFAPLEMTCALGQQGAPPAPAHVVSSALLQCEAPPSAAAAEGEEALVVLREGSAATEHHLLLAYAAPPVAATATPAAGPASGGAVVALGGRGLRAGDALACWLGTLGPLAARAVAAGAVECVAPAHVPATVPALVSWLGEFAPGGAAPFTYWQPPWLPDGAAASPWPDAVPAAGGATVLLTMSEPPPGVALFALLGRAAAALALEHAGGATLLAPPHAPGFVPIQLDYDVAGAAMWALGGQLQFVTPPHLASVQPRLGTWAGGTVLHATGTHFRHEPGATALFVAGVRAPGGAFASSALFVAEAPPFARADVDAAALQLSSAAAAAAAGALPALTSDGVEYLYVPLALAAAAAPAAVGEAGGTLVTLRGAGLRDSADLRCHFGSTTVAPAGVPSAQAVLCAAPARAPTPWAASVALLPLAASNNGLDRVFAARGGSSALAYIAEPELQHGAPDDGLASGGAHVQLWGASLFPAAALLLCGFDAQQAATFDVRTAEDDVLSSARCVAPAHGAGFVALQLSLAGSRNSSAASAVQFQFLPPPTARFSWPAKAMAVGGTVVTVLGTDFGVGGPHASLHIRFGSARDGASAALAPARIISSALLTVETPPEGAAAAAALPAAASQAHTLDAPDFAYVAPPRLLAAAPVMGSVRGGTVVAFAGTGFATGEQHFCRFGSVGPIAAEFVSDTLLRCSSPAHAPGAPVQLAVSRANLVDFVSTVGVVFEF